MMPGCTADNIDDLVIQIDGRVLLSLNVRHYPEKYDPYLFGHTNMNNLTYRGTGEIDGQGWIWWFKFTFNMDPDRPRLVRWYNINGGEWTGVKLKNSPNSHMKLT